MFKSFYFDHTKASIGTMNRLVAYADSQNFVMLSVPPGVTTQFNAFDSQVFKRGTPSIYFGVGQDTDFEVFHPDQLNDFIPGAKKIENPTLKNLMAAMEAYFQ